MSQTATGAVPASPASVGALGLWTATALVTGTNILAIHGLNLSSNGADSADFLALPQLSAISSDASGACCVLPIEIAISR